MRTITLALAMLAIACRADGPTAGDGTRARVTVSAALAGTGARALTILVTGNGVATPIVVNLELPPAATVATTAIDVPVGAQRTFTARAFDDAGTLTHEGMTTLAVRAGANAPVGIRLYPRTGEVPIDVGIGAYGVEIAPTPVPETLVGSTQRLVAIVTDGAGEVVPGARVSWGSLDRAVADVDASGLVTAKTAGRTTIYAVHRGAAASVDLLVGDRVPELVLREIATGLGFTCALDDGGAAWCWGANDRGQLGDGSSEAIRTRPVPVAGGLRFTSLASGAWHTCGLAISGEAWCWGWQFLGAIGNGQSPNEAARTPQRVLGGRAWRSLAAAYGATCAIDPNGDLWCWGTGVQGRIGLVGPGLNSTVPEPSFVASGPWSRVELSFSVSCALAPDGAATCDADNTSLVTTASAAAYRWYSLASSSESWDQDAATPTLLPAAGGPFACGVSVTSGALCWGDGSFGQHGNGFGLETAEEPMPVDDGTRFQSVVVGSQFACALEGSWPWCWGRNDFGQLGDGTTRGNLVPGRVSETVGFTRIEAGFAHACGIRANGAVLCWGANRWGELGDGTTVMRSLPVSVLGPMGSTP